MPDQSQRRAVYELLRDYARSGQEFTFEDIGQRLGWPISSTGAYVLQQFGPYLERKANGACRVVPEFKRVAWNEAQELMAEAHRPFASYQRATYDSLVIYDFVMPLTREDRLRQALDELFYRDTLERRIQEVGLEVLARAIPRDADESDSDYTTRIIEFVAERVSGYSVSHVSGRYRVGEILSRQKSLERVAVNQPYISDQTTAIVRFIIPCLGSKTVHGSDFDFGEPQAHRQATMLEEVKQIRSVFFELFVEALVPTIRGEKLIWILELSPTGQRLYELARLEPTPSRAMTEDGVSS